ncbi:MAG: CTP synthetase [Halocynthiibacter sp.]
MLRLASILFSMISTTLMGVAIVVALTIGKDTLYPILVAAAIGFVVSIPVTWIVTKMIADLK